MGGLGKALDITVPQYAYHRDKSGQTSPVIVVQAEVFLGRDAVGFRNLLDGSDGVDLLERVQLLGTEKPMQLHPDVELPDASAAAAD